MNELNVTPDDPRFFKRVFMHISKESKTQDKNSSPIKKAIIEEYGDLSRRLDKSQFQESCQVRNVLKSRRLAKLLIKDDGELDLSLVQEAVVELKNHCYSLGPGRQTDAPRDEHMLACLELLLENKNLQRQLKLVTRPDSHKVADQILRDTLQLEPHIPLTDAETKRAVLSAWFCYLRQSVGSCFATAPAILIQKEQPELFLKDILELLGTGRLKRIFAGVEYAVPLSITPGIGDYRKPVYFNREILHSLAISPGILNALESLQVIDSKLSLQEKVDTLRAFLLESFAHLSGIITAEIIVKTLLMKHHKITEKDITDFENRPRGMLHTSILMAPSSMSSRMGGKGEACLTYLSQIKLAESAFNALTDNALLKTWEYTLASFAETKPGFTKWNMYASLGFNLEEKGGIAECLYTELKQRVDRSNHRVEELQLEYEQVYSQLKYLESKLRNVASEKEAQWGKIEYESKRGEFRAIEELRDKEHFKAKRYTNLLNDLLDAYDTLFPKYFQEIYDPSMHGLSPGPYDDSPAGFRLLYKHGRVNTSQWSLIYTPQEFIEALCSFFIATEVELIHMEQFEGIQEEVSLLVTSLVAHIKTTEFIDSAFKRMAIAHKTPLIKDPLDHLDKIDKKPWAYTSGGTMDNLILCYFRLHDKPFQVQRWVENEMELLVFLIDSIRHMPEKNSRPYLNSKKKAILMHSPTHAFNLIPSFKQLKEAILSDTFSYTYARDDLVRQQERFIESLFLDDDMIQFLLSRLKKIVPQDYQHRFQSLCPELGGKKTPPEFRLFLSLAIEHDKSLQINQEPVLSKDQIDSALFKWLPLFSHHEIKNRLEHLLLDLPGLTNANLKQIQSYLEVISSLWEGSDFVTANQLQDISKAVLCLTLGTTASIDYPVIIAEKAQKLGYAMPAPIFFADTNWMKDYFAFVVNPGTGKLDLWRSDLIGGEGAPMSDWRQWLNGSDQTRTWGIYTKPYEYQA